MNEFNFQLPEAERHKLIEQYQPYVHKLALQAFRKFSGKFDLEELVSYGNLGLVEAAERFDPQRGVSFVTFAHYRVKGAIFDGLRQMGLRPIKQESRAPGFEAAANAILQTAADDQTGEAATTTVEAEVRSVENLIDFLIPAYLLSLDSEEAKNAADTSRPSAEEEIEKQELVKYVKRIVAELPEQEKDLLESFYFKHVSMTELAAQRGINKSWVSRLHTRAIGRIRDKLRDAGFLISEDEKSLARKI